jgi:hypothetical protein
MRHKGHIIHTETDHIRHKKFCVDAPKKRRTVKKGDKKQYAIGIHKINTIQGIQSKNLKVYNYFRFDNRNFLIDYKVSLPKFYFFPQQIATNFTDASVTI